MVPDPAKQRVIFAHRNSSELPMQIICEPSCSEYRVPPGSTIAFRAETRESRNGISPIMTETQVDGLTIWFEDTLYDPDAEIDGTPTDPFNFS